MPPDHRSHPDKQVPAKDYDADSRWKSKPLTPQQLLVTDVQYDTLRPDRGPMLELNERAASTLIPDTAAFTPSASFVRTAALTDNPIERQNFNNLEHDFGWMRHLRLDDNDPAKVRWVHCSSTFPEYLSGFLWALSDDLAVAEHMRLLDLTIQRNTRFSKHGKHFAPFSQTLQAHSGDGRENTFPLLISIPFLDWTVQGPTPPLRFQVDRREGFLSARSSAHIIRSILQHFYRLEDTTDREGSQVFAKHKPWTTNRELNLKVRQWYVRFNFMGLLIGVVKPAVDDRHIVTFSSNQSWKSRWPPLQLASRISDVAFRGIRNSFFRSNEVPEYTAITHAITCLSGSVGMLHRHFWPDQILCLSDRFGGHLGNLQYRLHRFPSSKLVMDLIACQEELNIVIQITEQQIDMIASLQSAMNAMIPDAQHDRNIPSPASRRPASIRYGEFNEHESRAFISRRSTFRQFSSSMLSDPTAQLLDNLERELVDLKDLRDNTDRLVTRTIQLVNIRLEDHGKAILVFTVVTMIFLPLNFISSFFGMNFSDIRDMEKTQWLFWAVALSTTAGVVTASVILAFLGGNLMERFHLWMNTRKKTSRQDLQMGTTTVVRQRYDDDHKWYEGFKRRETS